MKFTDKPGKRTIILELTEGEASNLCDIMGINTRIPEMITVGQSDRPLAQALCRKFMDRLFDELDDLGISRLDAEWYNMEEKA